MSFFFSPLTQANTYKARDNEKERKWGDFHTRRNYPPGHVPHRSISCKAKNHMHENNSRRKSKGEVFSHRLNGMAERVANSRFLALLRYPGTVKGTMPQEHLGSF